ncbi:MAG: hypothetical protein ACOCVF_00630 [bacterium]
MLILKKNIKLDNNQPEPHFNIALSNRDSMIDTEYENELDFNEIINSRVNKPIDNETRQFKYLITENNSMFYLRFTSLIPPNEVGSLYEYLNIGFTMDEIEGYLVKEVMLNSFYIVEIYDSNSINNKRLLNRSYCPIINKQPVFNLNNSNHFSKINIPKWFINEKIEAEAGDSTPLYMWVSFYNAKTGKISLFKNKIQNIEYFKINLNIQNTNKNTWNFEHPFTLIVAIEDNENIGYINKINNNVNNLELKKPNYPQNQYFNRETINYNDLT